MSHPTNLYHADQETLTAALTRIAEATGAEWLDEPDAVAIRLGEATLSMEEDAEEDGLVIVYRCPGDMDDLIGHMGQLPEVFAGARRAAVPTPDVTWIIPPECQGQMIETAYGSDRTEWYYRRTTDRSDGSVTLERVHMDDYTGTWEPQIEAPAIPEDAWGKL